MATGTTQTVTLKFMGNAAQLEQVLTQVGNGIKRVERRVNGMVQSISVTTGAMQSAGKAGMSFASVLGSVEKSLRTAVNVGMNFFNATRLISQGMMSVGRSMMFFVTPPIVIGLKKAYDAAVNFDAVMVRVKKTTGLTSESISVLARGIRDMAINTATAAPELGKIAEQLGQVGVRGIPQILSLVDLFNMLTVATDIAVGDVGISMGKLASAFGMDLNTDEGVEQITKLANVINKLENTFEAAAPEILDGMMNLAQAGAMLDFPPTTGAAMVTTLISMGMSADEAGTALRNMAVKAIQNAEDISRLMSATEKYNTEAKLLTEINRDAGAVLVDLAAAASQSEDKARALGAIFEATGIRGGRAWGLLAANVGKFVRSLNIAENEWSEATSLILEYEAALLATENQMGILRNNFAELAMTIGDVMLPVINTLIATIIPAVRRLTEAFRALPPHVQKGVVVFAAILALAGPLIFFLSQITFGLSMAGIAMMRMVQVTLSLLSAFGTLFTGLKMIGAALFSTFSMAQLAVVGLGLAVAALVIRISGLGERLANFFFSLAEKARSWGESLIAEYGTGILSAAVSILAKVLTAIGNFIAKFLAGRSPPELGPLSHIDEWGKTTFDAYLQGFLNADFSILNQVGGMIEKILSTLEAVGKIGEKAQFVFAMQARQDLARLIDIFNQTGEVSQSVLDDITRNLGEAADEVQKLIRLWLEYNDIQKQLAELEKRREGVLDTYRQEIQLIAQSNMTAEEKADAIRQAMRTRDEELRQIAQEEDILEDQKDEVETQLEFQKQMIAAMQHQDDLQLKLLDTLDKLSGKLDGLGDFEFPALDAFQLPEVPDLEEEFEEILTMKERINAGEKALQGFFDALKGLPFDDTLFAELQRFDEEAGTDFANTYQKLWEFGDKIRGIWEKANTVFQTVRETVAGIGDFLGGISTGEGIAFELPTLGDIGEGTIFEGVFAALDRELPKAWDDFLGQAEEFISAVEDLFADPAFKSALEEITSAFIELFGGAGRFAGGGLIGMIANIVLWLLKIGATVLQVGAWWVRVWTNFIRWVDRTKDNLRGFREDVLSFFERLGDISVEDIVQWARDAGQALQDWADGAIEDINEFADKGEEAIRTALMTIGTAIATWVSEREADWIVWRDNTVARIQEWATMARAAISEWVTGVIEDITQWRNDFNAQIILWILEQLAKFLEWKDGVLTTIRTFITDAKTAIAGWLIETLMKVITWWTTIRNTITTKLTEIVTKIREKIAEAKTKITDKISEFRQAGSDLIAGLIDGVVSKARDFLGELEGLARRAVALWNQIWGTQSPSQVMMEAGGNIVMGLVQGVSGMAGQFEQTLADTLGPQGALNQLSLGVQGFAPAGALSGGLPTPSISGQQQIVLQFGRDSVRSDRDIDEIAEQVERVIARRAQGNMSIGTGFGEGLT